MGKVQASAKLPIHCKIFQFHFERLQKSHKTVGLSKLDSSWTCRKRVIYFYAEAECGHFEVTARQSTLREELPSEKKLLYGPSYHLRALIEVTCKADVYSAFSNRCAYRKAVRSHTFALHCIFRS
jgi:hypothetical protein